MKNQSFDVIPAIDILGGKCVRLTQGDYNLVEEFSTNPEEVAKRWQELGAKRLHIVDLDGAKNGYPVNKKMICKIATKVKAKLQIGGGIRTIEAIKEYLDEGINYVILGTKAFQDKNFLNEVVGLYQEKIIIGLDLKNNRLALSGWQETSNIDLKDLPEYLKDIKQIIYTDISKDGTLSGPNIKQVEKIASIFKSNILISGGISSINDILEILKTKKDRHLNVSGVILGKSLYKGKIDLSSTITLVEKEIKESN